VAVQTRISLKFLEALEAGNFEILPETYIRAFIRDYAKAIGLDPDETIRRFDLHIESIKAAAAQESEEIERTARNRSTSHARRRSRSVEWGLSCWRSSRILRFRRLSGKR